MGVGARNGVGMGQTQGSIRCSHCPPAKILRVAWGHFQEKASVDSSPYPRKPRDAEGNAVFLILGMIARGTTIHGLYGDWGAN